MKKILFVDDEIEITEAAKGFFEEEGYLVSTADTAKDGISLLGKLNPDILILDMKLPDMSGMVVLEQVKRLSPGTKVIVNTGYVDQAMIDQTEKLGRDAFLQKPFDLFILKDEVDRLLGVQPAH